jgi:eukaryotic-like serine/threonine-protein kinase
MPSLLEQYEQFLRDERGDIHSFLSTQASLTGDEVIELLRWDLRYSWKSDSPRDALFYCEAFAEYTSSDAARVDLAVAEFQARNEFGKPNGLAHFVARFPGLVDQIEQAIAALDNIPSQEGIPSQTGNQSSSMCDTMERGELFCNRYRLDQLIGEGAFAEVFQAYDIHLKRRIALKIPTKQRAEDPDYVSRFLEEARTVAKLEHPNIVTVYDSGLSHDGRVYVASRLIDGRTLDAQMMEGKVPPREAARWVSIIARALQHAHQMQWIHRDVKPSNILIETSTNTPFLADFGLAVREDDVDEHASGAGTPSYMSPEQIRGEGHRLDGRSDQFSLAIVFYELLCGKPPFRGQTLRELFHQIISSEPQPPSEISEDVPLELQRICMKALSKRISDRYLNISDMADELEDWLNHRDTIRAKENESIVKPKGLRSFDQSDSRFFLDLMPGTRNREGLPDCIAFWKERIEENDPDQTFSVGLLYGPSGCGKSSMVKAGLLPNLSPRVTAIYVEATPFETEVRIRKGIEKRFPELTAQEPLATVLSQIRRRKQGKVVLIIDQLEQWLHALKIEQENELVTALRQCDGGRLQALLMVRDDFGLAASRFMQALDVRIVERENFAIVDLFDIDHAKKVLAKFGQSYGRLPRAPAIFSEEEDQFLQDATQGLAKEGKIVSVQLSLFADMVKKKPWNLQTLKQVGGTDGIGVHFLDETFEGRETNPDYRRHAVAARAVLRSLLPELGTDIKGHMQSNHELQEASGYANKPIEFKELLRILDGDLRLITPTDPEGSLSSEPGNRRTSRRNPRSESGQNSNRATPAEGTTAYYQLTHDYLVPPLREWLTRKQQETRRGRAELKLAERTAAWFSHPENKQFPTLGEWASIRLLTDGHRRTPSEQVMLKLANRFHWTRLAAAALILGLTTAGGLLIWNQVTSNPTEKLVDSLKIAALYEVPTIINQLDMDGNPEVAKKCLERSLSSPGISDNALFHVRLASARYDAKVVSPLLRVLLNKENELARVALILQRLRTHAGERKSELRAILRNEEKDVDQRFRAAMALAAWDPESNEDAWTDADREFISRQFVKVVPNDQPLLRDIFFDSKFTASLHLNPADTDADYATHNHQLLCKLLTYVDGEQFKVLYPLVENARTTSTSLDLSPITKILSGAGLSAEDSLARGQRRANAAVTLLRLRKTDEVLPVILPVFEMSDDPEALTQFISRCRERDVPVEKLWGLLNLVSDQRKDPNQPPGVSPRLPDGTDNRAVHASYALLLALGEYRLTDFPESERDLHVKQLSKWYRNDPSSSIHSATGWLLRQWGKDNEVQAVDETEIPYSPDQEWFKLHVKVPNAEKPTEALVQLNFTFIVFHAGEYTLCHKDGARESDYTVSFSEPFAILDREITGAEFQSLMGLRWSNKLPTKIDTNAAANYVSWQHAAMFCRRLSYRRGVSVGDQAYTSPESLEFADDLESVAETAEKEAEWVRRNWQMDPRTSGFRLPTNAESEVAARGGTTTPYSSGTDIQLLKNYSWFEDSIEKWVHAPRLKRPNGKGLYDTQGNVREWTNDWEPDKWVYPKSVTDPLGPDYGVNRVHRGGSFSNGKGSITSNLSGDVPTLEEPTVGFRIALSLEGFPMPKETLKMPNPHRQNK